MICVVCTYMCVHSCIDPSYNHHAKAESPSKADMSRFKQLCIQLKNEPISKDGAGKGDA